MVSAPKAPRSNQISNSRLCAVKGNGSANGLRPLAPKPRPVINRAPSLTPTCFTAARLSAKILSAPSLTKKLKTMGASGARTISVENPRPSHLATAAREDRLAENASALAARITKLMVWPVSISVIATKIAKAPAHPTRLRMASAAVAGQAKTAKVTPVRMSNKTVPSGAFRPINISAASSANSNPTLKT